MLLPTPEIYLYFLDILNVNNYDRFVNKLI